MIKRHQFNVCLSTAQLSQEQPKIAQYSLVPLSTFKLYCYKMAKVCSKIVFRSQDGQYIIIMALIAMNCIC